MIKCFGKGRLTKDVELRYSKNNKEYATFTIASNRKFDNTKSDFFNCICFGKTATFMSNYFKKGQEIIVHGTIQIDKNESNNQYYTKFLVEEVEFCGKKSDNNNTSNQNNDLPYDNDFDTLPF